jgi:hypothetical protein
MHRALFERTFILLVRERGQAPILLPGHERVVSTCLEPGQAQLHERRASLRDSIHVRICHSDPPVQADLPKIWELTDHAACKNERGTRNVAATARDVSAGETTEIERESLECCVARKLAPTLVTRQRPRNPEAVFYLERAQGGAPLKERPEVDDIEIEPSLHPEMLYGCEVLDKRAQDQPTDSRGIQRCDAWTTRFDLREGAFGHLDVGKRQRRNVAKAWVRQESQEPRRIDAVSRKMSQGKLKPHGWPTHRGLPLLVRALKSNFVALSQHVAENAGREIGAVAAELRIDYPLWLYRRREQATKRRLWQSTAVVAFYDTAL